MGDDDRLSAFWALLAAPAGAWGALTLRQRQVVYLMHVCELDRAGAAAVLDVSPKTISNCATRTREQLRPA